jgi:hypothetical protein
MQPSLQIEVAACLAEDGFSLDELVIETRNVFETEGMAGLIGLILRLTDELICRRLVTGETVGKPPCCCEKPRYEYKDFLERTFRTSAGKRLKRMAFGWSERGAQKMCRIVLK